MHRRLIDECVALYEQKSRRADLITYYTGIRDTLQAGAYARWSEAGK